MQLALNAKRTPHLSAGHWYRPVAFGLTAGILALFVVELTYGWTVMGWSQAWANDLEIYTAATDRLFSGGSWFFDRQLHGPYPLVNGDVLYPPVAAFVFAPWIVLPFALYLGIALSGLAWLVWDWKPAPWAWPLLALCLLYPGTGMKTIAGNPSIYAALFTGLGLRYGWPAAMVLLKPSLAPFALVGIRDRRWWIVAGLIVVGSLPFIPTTLEWPAAALNAQGGGLLYSVADLPMVLLPVIAWASRRAASPNR